MNNNNNNNNNTGGTSPPAAAAPSAIPSPPQTKRITTPVPGIGVDENVSPASATINSSTGLIGALPGAWRGGSAAPSYVGAAPSYHHAANDLDVNSIGFDERLVLTAPDFQPVAFGGSGGQQQQQQQQHDTPQAVVTIGDPFSLLSIDPLACCLSHLSAFDIDSLRLTSKASLAQCTSSPAWRLHCLRTGKLLPQDIVPPISSSSQIREAVSQLPSLQDDRFFALYRSSICVPEDCTTLAAAIRLAVLKGIKVITLMPGEYRERIAIDGDFIEDIVSTVSNGGGTINGRRSSSTRTSSSVLAAAGSLLRGRSTRSSRSISRAANSSSRLNEIMERGINLEIRAANPRLLTTLVHISGTADGNDRNNAAPTVSIEMNPNSNLEAMMLSDEGAGISLTLSNLSILNSVPGTDIWTTNTAIRASGNGVALDTRNCLITSMSGRGIVLTGGASGDLVSTTVFNCAATGIYVGDQDTDVTLTRCNVVNCGYGGRPIASSSSLLPMSTTGPVFDLLAVIESSMAIQTLPVTVGNESIVPSGHSGVYCEAAYMVLEDSLISGSCLTGITAVRGGRVALTGCDLADNAAEDISTQDSFLVERAQLNELDEDMEGIVQHEEKTPNKIHSQFELRDGWPSKLFRRFEE